MKLGLIAPQGWTGEYAGLDPRTAWRRTVDVAQAADRLGFESVWLFDHFHTVPKPADQITFESFTSLAALAPLTSRVRLGHVVICTAFRNPAVTAKMISTMDTISGGRMELGIGAGWKREEWEAYGFEFPPTRERLRLLEDSLEIVTRMFAPGRASHEGRYARVRGAINEPKPLQQPRVPIIVGGNGPEVTWRLAARFADELNLDALSPDEVRAALPVIRSRCEEVGRDPATLRISVHVWWGDLEGRESRRELLAAHREAGVDRVMGLFRETAQDPSLVEAVRDDALAAGLELADPTAD